MRIISGTHKGRPFEAPKGQATRPILDRQKESLFNVLREALPCEGVLDVFAGSGALGFEALSRGASRATFVDRGRQAVGVLRRNVASLGFGDRAQVLVRDAFTLDASRIHPFALLFLDPPFPLYERHPTRVHGLMEQLLTSATAAEDVRGVLRVPVDAEVPAFPDSLELVDRRPFGESLIMILSRRT